VGDAVVSPNSLLTFSLEENELFGYCCFLKCTVTGLHSLVL
jgi:hypothetical protein